MKRKIFWNEREVLVKILNVLRDISPIGESDGFDMVRNVLCNPICGDRYEDILKELGRLVALYKTGPAEGQRLYKAQFGTEILRSLEIGKTLVEAVRG